MKLYCKIGFVLIVLLSTTALSRAADHESECGFAGRGGVPCPWYGLPYWGHHQSLGHPCAGKSTSCQPRPIRSRPRTTVEVETQSLNQLYQLALAEGGTLILYAGGDSVTNQDATKVAFEQRFPGMTLDVIVDFSKYHNSRIYFQLANHSLVPDCTQLQTLQDFPIWKKQGVLLNYKPVGWNQIYDSLKDPDGFFYPISTDTFSNVYNKKLLPNPAQRPLEAHDYLKPEFKGKIVVTYPDDDDAALFWFKQVVDKYGWDWVYRFKEQNVTYVRGTRTSRDLVGSGQFSITFTADGTLAGDPSDPTGFQLPKKDPFVVWAQTAAIFKDAKNPAAAKLYMNWQLEKQRQSTKPSWSVRRDVPPPAGYRSPFGYQSQTSMAAFLNFMVDRQGAEIFRTQIALILGEVQGPPPTRSQELGIAPSRSIPHVIVP